VRMYCTPTVCWVQPTLYTRAVVRSRPELLVTASQTARKFSGGMPQICSIISGVYREKCRFSTWKTHRGCCSVSSVSGDGCAAAPPEPCASPRAASRTWRRRPFPLPVARLNRGSTWMTVAPRALASITHWKPTGCASAMFEPSMRMQSAFCRSCRNVVAPPRPKLVPRPGTVDECQIRA